MTTPTKLLLKLYIGLAVVLLLTAGLFHWQSPTVAQAATQIVSSCDETSLNSTINNANANDTIAFSCSGTITLTATINISKTLTLDGTGQSVTLSGGNSVQVLNVYTNTNLSLNNLFITNGNASNGGAISNYGTLVVSNTTFAYNKANYGGVIYNYNNNDLTIAGSTFTGNKANGLGGIIYNNGTGNISAIDSTFTSNSASSGGLIYNASSGNISFTSSTIGSNFSFGPGGVINNQNGGSIGFYNSTVISNSSISPGGVVYNTNAAISSVISNSTVISNSSSNFGGVIYNDGNGGAMTVYSSTINYNKNGAIYSSNGASLTISNSNLISNTSNTQGGAVYLVSGNLSVSKSNFNSNQSYGPGGAIYASNVPNISLSSSTFISNASGGQGGAISASGTGSGNLSVYSSTLNYNSVNGGVGGAINSSGYASTTISNSDLISNTAGGGPGGAIYNSDGNLSIYNSRFNNNKSNTSPGGGVFNGNGTINVVGSTFLSNTAGPGGAIYSSNGGNSTIYSTTLSYNTSSSIGGAVSISSSSLTISNSTLISNTSTSPGGAVYFGGGILGIYGSNLSLNSSGNSPGGAIYSGGSSLVITTSNFISNTTTILGGAIFNTASDMAISNATFSGNNAQLGGGAIASLSGGTGTISNSTFDHNMAFSAGGAITNTVSLIITNSTFASNSSTGGNGGALANATSGVITVTNGTFSGNSAVNGGGAIFNAGTANLKNSILAGSSNCASQGSSITNGGYNLSSDNSCSFSGTSQNNVSNLNLGTLTDNGGATETIMLLPGSIAIGFVGSNNCPATDQRGATRPAVGCSAGAVEVGTSSVSLTTSTNPSVYGQPITVTATVSPTIATGTVTVTVGSTTVTRILTNGSASYITSTLPVGSTTITATYGGNNYYTSSTSAVLTQTVNASNTSTSLSASPTTANLNDTITFTATVAVLPPGGGIPTGTVVFTDTTTNTQLASASLITTANSGIATLNLAPGKLAVGSHSVTASFTGNSNYNGSVSNLITLTILPPSSNYYTYYLPYLSNGANSSTTYPVVQNVGTVPTTLNITFYDTNGNVLDSPPSLSGNCNSIAVYGECILPNPYTSTTTSNLVNGSATITTTQPLNIVIPEATSFGGSAYSIGSGATGKLIVPIALNGAYGDFKTYIDVYNANNNSANVTLTFFNADGTPAPTSSTQTFILSAHTAQAFNQSAVTSNLLTGFNGWAMVTGNDANSQMLVAQVIETSLSHKFVAIANGWSGTSTTLYAPAMFRNGYGGFYTGANIVNPNNMPVTVTVTYYDLNGTPVTTAPFTLGANAAQGIYQGSNGGNGLPAGGLSDKYVGAAVVNATGGGIVMVINEDGGQTGTGNERSGTYAALAQGGSQIGLPVIANGAFGGYVTGDTIFNTSNQAVTATISFYNLDGSNAGANTSTTFTIGAKASQAFYNAASNLPSGFYGTAIVKVTSGPTNALLVTTNAQSNALFYTYSEPNF